MCSVGLSPSCEVDAGRAAEASGGGVEVREKIASGGRGAAAEEAWSSPSADEAAGDPDAEGAASRAGASGLAQKDRPERMG